MATIIEPTLHFPENIGGGTLKFKVTYKLLLEADEVVSFDHAAKLWEEDGSLIGGDDDQVTAHPIPQQFNPGSQITTQTLFIFAPRDAADTEVGNEEYKAQIWLRRTGSTGPADAEVFTNVVAVDE